MYVYNVNVLLILLSCLFLHSKRFENVNGRSERMANKNVCFLIAICSGVALYPVAHYTQRPASIRIAGIQRYRRPVTERPSSYSVLPNSRTPVLPHFHTPILRTPYSANALLCCIYFIHKKVAESLCSV